MAVEKDHAKKLVQTVREAIPGVKDKVAGMYAQFRENPREFLSQRPVAWTLGIIGMILATVLLVGFYSWLKDYQTEGDKAFKTASKEQSLLVVAEDGGMPFTMRGVALTGDGPFTDQATGKKCWRALLTPDGQYYSAKPGPEGKPVPPPPLPTPTPAPTPKGKLIRR